MLKYFKLGRRVNFPLIFLATEVVLFNVGFLVLKISNIGPSAQSKSIFELLIAVTGAAAAFVYFLYSQQHQDMQMFVSLFEKFNNRYNDLNEKLNAIFSRPANLALAPAQIDVLYDYFNLCAEEHLFYEAGYIDEIVWQAWLRGMKYFASDYEIHQLWKSEIESGSYYNFKFSLLDAVGSSKSNK